MIKSRLSVIYLDEISKKPFEYLKNIVPFIFLAFAMISLKTDSLL